MASKAVSIEQGLSFRGRLMKGEELYETVKKVWIKKELTCLSEGLFGPPLDCLCNTGFKERKRLSTRKERFEFWNEKGFYDNRG